MTAAWHVTRMAILATTDYARRPAWLRTLVRWRNRFIPWFMWWAV